MAPLTPHWEQPSHPSIQTVIFSKNKDEFTSKSLSKIALPPFALYAKMDYPPCTSAEKATYATVQVGEHEHLNLNSDLVYINHSCEPSVMFDMPTLSIIAGPNGLTVDQELTFFYPSTEWDMAQGFDCFCGSKNCKGWIDGAGNMRKEQLEGMWLNGWIRDKLARQYVNGSVVVGNGVKVYENGNTNGYGKKKTAVEGLNGHGNANGVSAAQNEKAGVGADGRRGVTSRELSGEMGGDTQRAF